MVKPVVLDIMCSLDSISGSIRDSKCNSPSSPKSSTSPADPVMLSDTSGKTSSASSPFTHVLQSLASPVIRGRSSLPFLLCVICILNCVPFGYITVLRIHLLEDKNGI